MIIRLKTALVFRCCLRWTDSQSGLGISRILCRKDMSGLKHTFCCFLRRKITFKQEFRQQRSDFRNLNLASKISLKSAFSMGRFLICAGEATDFENVPRNWHEEFGRSSFAALTSRVFFCSPSGSHFATQKQENSRRRATPGSAIAPLLRNGYAALRIRAHWKSPPNEQIYKYHQNH